MARSLPVYKRRVASVYLKFALPISTHYADLLLSRFAHAQTSSSPGRASLVYRTFSISLSLSLFPSAVFIAIARGAHSQLMIANGNSFTESARYRETLQPWRRARVSRSHTHEGGKKKAKRERGRVGLLSSSGKIVESRPMNSRVRQTNCKIPKSSVVACYQSLSRSFSFFLLLLRRREAYTCDHTFSRAAAAASSPRALAGLSFLSLSLVATAAVAALR